MIHLDDKTHLLVLTGAGISAESGVPTFRDANGLWQNHRFEDLASPEGFAADPLLVWKFYSQRRRGLDGVTPNSAHRALVDVEQKLGDRFLLVTQNVDGLHAAAGSQRIVEMHGNIMRTKCGGCRRAPFADRASHDTLPPCDECGALLRPDIVWFGESIPPAALRAIEVFLQHPNVVFLAVGTSGVVYPAAGIVDVVKRAGGTTWLVNAERPANVSRFDHVEIGPAGTVLPALFA
ncbi:MAG: NAD-dependent deacylase [Myxococcota bacterium]|nr:NAD-dependent deacylase [Deltaproteobacteria bacterium]MDQ3337207.1 NAD-dependent deacylase [Myxococcota bacterium]